MPPQEVYSCFSPDSPDPPSFCLACVVANFFSVELDTKMGPILCFFTSFSPIELQPKARLFPTGDFNSYEDFFLESCPCPPRLHEGIRE